MTNKREATQTVVEREEFKLKLPQVFDIKPAHEIELPGKRKALVYDTTVENWEDNGKEGRVKRMKQGWRVIVITKLGFEVAESGYYRFDRGFETTDPLDVKLHISKLVKEFSKRKRTTIDEREIEE